MQSKNPKNGHLLATYDTDTQKQLERKLIEAREAFQDWRETPLDKRAASMRRAADVLAEHADSYARQMTDEMGKPIEQARGEIDKCGWVCEYFAERAADFLEPASIETDASRSYVRYEPLGPILAIMPWNFPFWQVFRFAAPHLIAGNVGLLSHARNVLGCAESIEEIFERAGFPPGVFQNIVTTDDTVQELIDDKRIRGVTLTGSVRAGSAVAAEAGRAIKPTVLELGGSDPFVVLEDADLERAVEQAVRARTLNSGQSCIAAKRFIVEEGVYEPFVEAFERELSACTVGDPLDEKTDLGPIAREDLRETLHRQVAETIEQGAHCRLGGEMPEGPGFFYPVTLLTDVDETMTAFKEETFGPVAAVTPADEVEHAIQLANRSPYGLGASLWTETDRGESLTPRIESGHVAVNGIVKSDPRLPFGGIKHSGYGRELARDGMLEFANKKSVWIR